MKKIIFLLLLFIIVRDILVAQNSDGYLEVKATVLSQGAPLKGAGLKVFNINQLIYDTISDESGKLNVSLEYGYSFMLEFSKEGMQTKKLAFNTHVPENEKSEIGFFEFKVDLFKTKESTPASTLFPIATIAFDPADSLFNYTEMNQLNDSVLFKFKNAEFIGGMEGFKEFMEDKEAWRQDIKRGQQGIIWINFILTRDGEITDLQMDSSSFGRNTGDRIFNELKNSKGKWNAAELAGEKIDSRIEIRIIETLTYKSSVNFWYNYKAAPAISISSFYYNMGVKFSETNDFEKAISCFSACLKLNPNDIDALYNRGIMFHKTKNDDASCKDWEWAKALGDSDSKRLFEKYCSSLIKN